MNKRLSALFLVAFAALAMLLWQHRPQTARERQQGALERATALIENGKPDEAVPLLTGLILREPGNARLFATLGHAYLIQGRYDLALQPLETAWSLETEQPHLACELADAYVHLRDRSAANAFIETALKRNPTCPHAHLVAGEQYLRDDDLTRALAEFRESIRIAPHAAIAYQRAGYILRELSRSDEAEKVLQQGLQVAPDNVAIQLQLGRLYAARPSVPGALDQAAEHYRAAIQGNPNSAEIYAALGTIARQQKRLADAEQLWRRALRSNRNEATALYGLGQLLLSAGKKQAAEPLLRHYREVQQFQRKVADLRTKTAIRRSMDDRFQLARLSMAAGTYDEADRQLTALLRERPDDAEVRAMMGELCLALQRPEEAQLEFRIASSLPRR